MRQIRSRPCDTPLGGELLGRLQKAWGNPFYAASVPYLRAIDLSARQCKGAILECGTGVSTLLLGLLGKEVWSLEHDAYWYRHMRALARKFGLSSARLVYAPLCDYGGFEWYKWDLHAKPQFSLVVCDGPSGDICGGRYGLLPIMRAYLKPSAGILLDDAGRSSEAEVLRKWVNEFGVSHELHGTGETTFAIITCSARRSFLAHTGAPSFA